MRDREGAANLAAIANLPIGWLFEDPRRDHDDLVLRATSAEGDEIEVSGPTAEEAWRAMAESLAALGRGAVDPVAVDAGQPRAWTLAGGSPRAVGTIATLHDRHTV